MLLSETRSHKAVGVSLWQAHHNSDTPLNKFSDIQSTTERVMNTDSTLMETEDKNMHYERLSVLYICSIDMTSAVNVWSGHVFQYFQLSENRLQVVLSMWTPGGLILS